MFKDTIFIYTSGLTCFVGLTYFNLNNYSDLNLILKRNVTPRALEIKLNQAKVRIKLIK